jgi:hypothetical protein
MAIVRRWFRVTHRTSNDPPAGGGPEGRFDVLALSQLLGATQTSAHETRSGRIVITQVAHLDLRGRLSSELASCTEARTIGSYNEQPVTEGQIASRLKVQTLGCLGAACRCRKPGYS